KPNVFDFRVDANSALDSSYAHNLSAIFDKVVPIFMKDRFVQREEFQRSEGYRKFRTHLYATFLNRDDYIMLRDLVWKLSASEGDISQNMLEQYSIPEFAKQRDALEVLAARIELAEGLARKQGVQAADLYSIPKSELKKIADAANLKGAARDTKGNQKYLPAARFESHPDNRSGLPLADMIETYAVAGNQARRNSGVRRMLDTHMRRIKMLADVGIFHADDVRRLNDWYGVAQAYTERVGAEERNGLAGVLLRAASDWRVRITESVTELKGIMLKTRAEEARKTAEGYEAFTKAFASEQEAREYEDNLRFLQDIFDKGAIYSGRVLRPMFGRKYSLDIGAMRLNTDWEKNWFWSVLEDNPGNGVFHVYSPAKVKAKADEFRHKHTTLDSLYRKEPELKARLDAVVASGFAPLQQVFSVSEGSFETLQSIVSAEHPENFYLSDDLVRTLHNVCNRMEAAQQEKNAYNVDSSVMDVMANRWYEKTAGDPNVRYNVFIPGGKKGRPDNTYPHKQFLRTQLHMVWNGGAWGYELRGITEAQLGEVTTLVAKRNSDYRSKLLIRLTS
ncbi:hypothetical protein KY363_02780, partial [Candidatus Woesearchaeota archaeon]|nr:hypothetical protein [Candidatus Woesearchaeota archaeon]